MTDAERQARRRAKAKKGFCRVCCVRPHRKGSIRCEACHEAKLAWQREDRKRKAKAARKAAKKQG